MHKNDDIITCVRHQYDAGRSFLLN